MRRCVAHMIKDPTPKVKVTIMSKVKILSQQSLARSLIYKNIKKLDIPDQLHIYIYNHLIYLRCGISITMVSFNLCVCATRGVEIGGCFAHVAGG